MKIKFILLVSFFGFFIFSFANPYTHSYLKNRGNLNFSFIGIIEKDSLEKLPKKVKKIKLGKENCKFVLTKKTNAIATLFCVHDNENTSIDAFNSLSNANQFNLIELNQHEERLIKYQDKDGIILFDPNRIFTKIGIEKTLEMYNKTAEKKYVKKVQKFSKKLLSFVLKNKKSPYIVAIHNNTNDNFSIQSYIDSKDTQEIYINPNEDMDDFAIVTEAVDFEYFKSKKLNVVLLGKDFEDDGSLSVYCQINHIPYINLEAENGHVAKQTQMLQATYDLLRKN